jgi:hypothetical protein
LERRFSLGERKSPMKKRGLRPADLFQALKPVGRREFTTANGLRSGPSRRFCVPNDGRPRQRRDAGVWSNSPSPRRSGVRSNGDIRRSRPNRDAVGGYGLRRWARAAQCARRPAPLRLQGSCKEQAAVTMQFSSQKVCLHGLRCAGLGNFSG